MLYISIIIYTIAMIISILTIQILQRQNDELLEKYNKLSKKYISLQILETSISTDDIKITYWFKQKTPNDSKMAKKEKYLLENGNFESRIILDKKLRLKDGYTSYLLAKKYNIKNVDVIII